MKLSTLSPADLRGLGLEVDSTTHASEGLQTAFVGYGDQNRDGALEFYFAGDRLREFYARCHTRCDYELSWPPHRRFSLPIGQRQLIPAIDRPVSMHDYLGH